MLTEKRMTKLLPLLLCCLLNFQAYAAEENQKIANEGQPKTVSGTAALSQNGKAENKAAVKNAVNIPPANTAAKPAAAEHKAAAAQSHQKAAGKPAETAKHSPQSEDTRRQSEATATIEESLAAGGLQSPSVIEAIFSLLLLAVFFLILIRGNIFKHHK